MMSRRTGTDESWSSRHGWGWWRHRVDETGKIDARRRLEDARGLARRLTERREENGFGEEIASALKIGRVAR